MASLVARRKGNQLYYYVVESARVEGKPRIVHQAYLGTADKVVALVKDRTAPVPLSAASRDFGLPGALWLAAEQTGLFGLLETLWPASRSGPSPARYLLLAAIHTHLSTGAGPSRDWYGKTILHSIWGIPPERFTSQAFWDAFEKILPEHLDPLATGDDDPLDRAQLRLLDLWNGKQMVSRRLLAYDTTNFYTYIASHNTRNEVAQRGHNKQGRHNLHQVGLSYVGRGTWFELVPSPLSRQCGRQPGVLPPRWHACCWTCWIAARSRVTRSRWCWTKGSAALANTVGASGRCGLDLSLPWNQAPSVFRERAVEQLPLCSSAQPGVRAAAEKLLVTAENTSAC